MQGREVYDHETGNHVVNLNRRREADQIGMESGHQQNVDEGTTKPYPWKAPRVLLQYLVQTMNTKEPTMWSMDIYDGEEIWHDHKWKPKEEYRHDEEVNPDQYHKLTHHLYQAESATEVLMIKKQVEGSDNNVEREWQRIKCDVRERCLDIFKEVEDGEDVDEVDMATNKAQMEYNQKEGKLMYHTRQLAMFETGNETKVIRRRREEDSCDEEEPCQLVCNMTGSKWQSSPYPIIVDSTVCASVMSTSWCEHVPLRETPQSQAGGVFRDANGQTIRNMSMYLIA